MHNEKAFVESAVYLRSQFRPLARCPPAALWSALSSLLCLPDGNQTARQKHATDQQLHTPVSNWDCNQNDRYFPEELGYVGPSHFTTGNAIHYNCIHQVIFVEILYVMAPMNSCLLSCVLNRFGL